jgi:NDP-sugar pyrophosphorylase family protein
MRPRTLSTPKFLLPVAGRPFAAWQLARLAGAGYGEAVLCVGHLGEAIRAAVGDGAAFGLRVRYVDEGADLRGTGGALGLAAAQGALAEQFLVTYGDSYLPFDYAAPLDLLAASADLDGVMAVYANGGRIEPSNAALTADGARVARYAKGAGDPGLDHIDYGATALRRRALAGWPERFGLDALQAALAAAGRLGAVAARERFYEVGSEAGLAALDAHLRAVVAAGPRA